MKKLKWFSGGKDRKEEAITAISKLINNLDSKSNGYNALHDTLQNYQVELENGESSVPLVLSRMNIEISNTIQKNNIVLSDVQLTEFKKLSALSSIRYGY